jgi:glycosyltransferase A (GT-A) superfamily protein (DUF2064 family)
MTAHALVVAKAPVPGEAKTRLGADVGDDAAAELAAAALLDTLAACADAFPGRCHLALAGDLGRAARGSELRSALRSWHVFDQVGTTFGARLAHAHLTLAAEWSAPVVQVGMDTPQVTAALLSGAAEGLRPGYGVLAPADDGGWWLLGLGQPAAAQVLAGIPMSTPRTAFDTRRALVGWGVRVTTAPVLRDVDTVADAAVVAREAPATRFAEAWSRLPVGVV